MIKISRYDLPNQPGGFGDEYKAGLNENDLHKYFPIETISNVLAKLYLHYTRRIEHGIGTELLIQILNDLYRRHDNQGKPLIEDYLLLKMLQITALLHDSGRECDFGDDSQESETKSGEIIFRVLINLDFDEDYSEMLKYVVINKDEPEKLAEEIKKAFSNNSRLDELLKLSENCRTLLHDADVLEVIRSHSWKFDITKLELYAAFKQTNLKLKDLFDIIRGLKQVQNAMGDSPRALHITEKLPYPSTHTHTKKSELPDVCVSIEEPSFYDEKIKTVTVSANTISPFDDIYQIMLSNRYLSKFFEHEMIVLPIFSSSQQSERHAPCIKSSPKDALTTTVMVPPSNEHGFLEYKQLLDKNERVMLESCV